MYLWPSLAPLASDRPMRRRLVQLYVPAAFLVVLHLGCGPVTTGSALGGGGGGSVEPPVVGPTTTWDSGAVWNEPNLVWAQ